MSASHDDCIFCRILQGESAATFLLREEDCSAFMDIEPINPGHLLVVPNRHAAYLADMDAGAAARLMSAGHRLAAALRQSGLRCEGVNFFLADGAVAGQEVFHVHLHVIPRFRGDGFGLRWGAGRRVREREELDQAGAAIRRRLPQ